MTDEPIALLKKATASITALERLAEAGPAAPDAIRAFAREHFRLLLAAEHAVRAGEKAKPAAPAKASLPAENAPDPRFLRSVAEVSAADQADSIAVALGELLSLTGAQRGFIALREADGSLSFPAARAFGALDLTTPEAELSRSILAAALQKGASLVVDDARADARFGMQGSVQALSLRAVLVVPLVARGGPFGVLYLDNPSRAASFDDDARRTAEAFARTIAPVLARDLELGELRLGRDARLAELREKYDLGAFVGQSRPMIEVLELITKVAPRDATVLVTGETGTGKELVAQAIHTNSARAAGPLVTVNCGALPSELVESELFGHEKGAFTGAHAARVGRFEAAKRGTVFLDEIGELPPAAQVKLLRVLESGTFERVGSTRPQRCDVRVIAATNRDLDAEVAAGRFRADLLFRLKVIEIRLPPLRARGADVELLTRRFVERFCKEHGARVRRIHPAALDAIAAYNWPGNVRELRNVLERAVILASGEELTVDLLPPEIAGSAPSLPADQGLKQAVRAFKKRFVERAIDAAGGDHAAAAKRLGVNAKYLYQLIKDLDTEEG
ncbi:MAG: sigma-54-dependent Fis family transcriptional regulator [Minicystis sp.]